MGEYTKQVKYQKDLNTQTAECIEDEWGIPVRRSWNALLANQNDNDGKETKAPAYLLAQLEDLDKVFTTHFPTVGGFFLSGAPEWAKSWDGYAKAIVQHVKGIAQRPERNHDVMRISEQLLGKVRFVLLNHGSLHLAPPFPLMTKSVIPPMMQALTEIDQALYEVRLYFHSLNRPLVC